MAVLLLLSIVISLLFVPIELKILVENADINITIKFLFLKFGVKKSINKEKREKRKLVTKKMGKLSLNRLRNTLDKVELILQILSCIIKKIKFEKINFKIIVSSHEAKDCATLYSDIYSFFCWLTNFFELKKRVKTLKINVYPDFLSYKSLFFTEISLKMILYELIFNTIKIIIKFLKKVNSINAEKIF